MPPNRLEELVVTIKDSHAVIQDYLSVENQPVPSFEDGISPGLQKNTAAAAARQQLLVATEELHALMLGPIGSFTHPSHNFMISMQAICKWDLATAVPIDSAGMLFEDLAMVSGLDTSILKRILRHAIARRIFTEPKIGLIAHNAASRLLAQDRGLKQWIGMVAWEMWPAATKVVDALSKWPESEEPNECGFNLAHNTDLTIFEELQKSPAREKRYAEAMAWFQSLPGFEVEHVLTSYDWDKLGASKVVDIGGSLGSVAVALAREFPSLRFVVQDRPEVVEQGESSLPFEFKQRVSFLAHNFFVEQVTKDADVYFMRFILHDWPNEYATRILKRLAPALKKGSKVLVQEHVLPAPRATSAYHEQLIRGFDLAMMGYHNGKERDLNEWMDLFHRADARYRFHGYTQPPDSRLALMEFHWD